MDRKKADSSLEIKISDEVNSRQEADDELSGRIDMKKWSASQIMKKTSQDFLKKQTKPNCTEEKRILRIR